MWLHIDQIENHEFEHSVRLLKKAGELGLLGADVPEEFGGLGLDKISSAIITEKFARAGSFSLSYGAHVGIGSLPIVLFGNQAQKETYLPGLASGETIAAYALTEPGSGSDALGAKTMAVLNEAGAIMSSMEKSSGSQTLHLPMSLLCMRRLMGNTSLLLSSKRIFQVSKRT